MRFLLLIVTVALVTMLCLVIQRHEITDLRKHQVECITVPSGD